MRVCRKKKTKDRKSNTPKHTMSRNGRIFPQSSQHEYAEGVELEVYPSADTTAPNYRCEIWVAVNEKSQVIRTATASCLFEIMRETIIKV